ncbi:hypothetical protein M3J09_011559 [Ascochyta lentis]
MTQTPHLKQEAVQQNDRRAASSITYQHSRAQDSSKPCRSNRLEITRPAYAILQRAAEGTMVRLHRALFMQTLQFSMPTSTGSFALNLSTRVRQAHETMAVDVK